MNGNEVLQQAIGFATYYIQQVMTDVTPEIAHKDPGGTMQTIAATYAHAIVSTDWQIHTFFRGQPALYEGEWASKTGVTPTSPMISPEWGKNVQVDLPQLHAYAQAVFGALMPYVAAADLDQMIDLSMINAGSQSLGWCLANLVAGHLSALTGQIAAVKGCFGLKGDMF
ncbi:MAG: DinB family protein [Caldilineaceae bacterium]|nr:DinB family protein [Caldilineaceae bacterium]